MGLEYRDYGFHWQLSTRFVSGYLENRDDYKADKGHAILPVNGMILRFFVGRKRNFNYENLKRE